MSGSGLLYVGHDREHGYWGGKDGPAGGCGSRDCGDAYRERDPDLHHG